MPGSLPPIAGGDPPVNHNPERSWSLHPREPRFLIEQEPALAFGLPCLLGADLSVIRRWAPWHFRGDRVPAIRPGLGALDQHISELCAVALRG